MTLCRIYTCITCAKHVYYRCYTYVLQVYELHPTYITYVSHTIHMLHISYIVNEKSHIFYSTSLLQFHINISCCNYIHVI